MVGKKLIHLSVMLCVTVSLGSDNLQQVLDSRESIKVARQYLEKCERQKTTVPLGNLGWKEVREYWAEVPGLKELRNGFKVADQALRAVLMKDAEYSEFMENRKSYSSAEYIRMKDSVFKRLNRTTPEYRKARKNREAALYRSNIETFRYIINEYEEQQ